MAARVGSLHYAPLKGGKMWGADTLDVNTRIGIAFDRRFALLKKPVDLKRRADKFNKMDYYCCANTAAMAIQEPDFLLGKSKREGYELYEPNLAYFAERIGAESPLTLQDTRGEYHLADTDGPQVSFLNLATLRALEKLTGSEVDPDRFRMNVWIRNLPPFAEYDWIDGYPGTPRNRGRRCAHAGR